MSIWTEWMTVSIPDWKSIVGGSGMSSQSIGLISATEENSFASLLMTLFAMRRSCWTSPGDEMKTLIFFMAVFCRTLAGLCKDMQYFAIIFYAGDIFAFCRVSFELEGRMKPVQLINKQLKTL